MTSVVDARVMKDWARTKLHEARFKKDEAYAVWRRLVVDWKKARIRRTDAVIKWKEAISKHKNAVFGGEEK